MQTPQTFDVKLIRKAFEQEYDETFTDEATMLEHIGIAINLIEGSEAILKLPHRKTWLWPKHSCSYKIIQQLNNSDHEGQELSVYNIIDMLLSFIDKGAGIGYRQLFCTDSY